MDFYLKLFKNVSKTLQNILKFSKMFDVNEHQSRMSIFFSAHFTKMSQDLLFCFTWWW